MPPVQRKGDANTEGAKITSGIDSVRVNNLAISVDGSTVEDHFKAFVYNHVAVTTTKGTTSVKAAGRPVNVKGNPDSCGHLRVGGSGDVKVG